MLHMGNPALCECVCVSVCVGWLIKLAKDITHFSRWFSQVTKEHVATHQDWNDELHRGDLLYGVAHLYPVEQGKLRYAFDRKYDSMQQHMIRQSGSK